MRLSILARARGQRAARPSLVPVPCRVVRLSAPPPPGMWPPAQLPQPGPARIWLPTMPEPRQPRLTADETNRIAAIRRWLAGHEYGDVLARDGRELGDELRIAVPDLEDADIARVLLAVGACAQQMRHARGLGIDGFAYAQLRDTIAAAAASLAFIETSS